MRIATESPLRASRSAAAEAGGPLGRQGPGNLIINRVGTLKRKDCFADDFTGTEKTAESPVKECVRS